MNREEKNKAYYKETFREVYASEALAGKVRNMAGLENRKTGMSVVKKLAIAAALAAVIFAGSNGVAYAMTGNTWFETVTVQFNLHGTTYDMDLEAQQEGDVVYYVGQIEENNGDKTTVVFEDADFEEFFYSVSESATLVETKDKVYLEDGDVKIDVTEDLKEDGLASGTYERNGITKEYVITKTDGILDYVVTTIREE